MKKEISIHYFKKMKPHEIKIGINKFYFIS
jgi:hypothetical protein